MKKEFSTTITSYQIFTKKNAPTLVLLHGWLQDWQSWSPLITTLSEKYQLVIPDIPGFGESTLKEKAWNSEQYAQWCAAFINSLELPEKAPLFIVGHSFGGKIAAVTTALHSTTPKITGLLLCSASGLPDTLSLSTQLKQTCVSCIPSPIKKIVSGKAKHAILRTLGISTDHLISSKQQRAILKLIVRENISEFLQKITIPTLLIWGKNDTDTPLHQGKEMHVLLAHSKLEIMDKSGHFPFYDQPKKCIASINSFVDSVSNTPTK